MKSYNENFSRDAEVWRLVTTKKHRPKAASLTSTQSIRKRMVGLEEGPHTLKKTE